RRVDLVTNGHVDRGLRVLIEGDRRGPVVPPGVGAPGQRARYAEGDGVVPGAPERVDALLAEEPREDQVVRHQRGDGARQLLSLEGVVCHVFPSGKWRSPRRTAEGFVDEWGWSEPVGAQSARLGARIERPFSGRG